jgi:hypothetical protein
MIMVGHARCQVIEGSEIEGARRGSSECRAERLHRWRIVAGNVEAVGIVKNVWVAVGGGVDNDLSQLTCR